LKNETSWNKLILKVIEIKGECPVYKIGDKTVIHGPHVDLESLLNSSKFLKIKRKKESFYKIL